jgi:hypothetical protein
MRHGGIASAGAECTRRDDRVRQPRDRGAAVAMSQSATVVDAAAWVKKRLRITREQTGVSAVIEVTIHQQEH